MRKTIMNHVLLRPIRVALARAILTYVDETKRMATFGRTLRERIFWRPISNHLERRIAATEAAMG